MYEDREYENKITPNKGTRYRNLSFINSGSHAEEASRQLPELYFLREDCSGCSACYAACPIGAISMEEDEEGFLYPVVDAKLCVKCYKCVQSCPIKAADKKRGIRYLPDGRPI